MSVLLMIAVGVGVQWYLMVVLIYISQMNDFEHFFHVPVSLSHVLLDKLSIHVFCLLFVFLFLSCKTSLYILVTGSLDIYNLQMFSPNL